MKLETIAATRPQTNEYEPTAHSVSLPNASAPLATASIVIDRQGRPQLEIILHKAGEQPLDKDGKPVGDPLDIVRYLSILGQISNEESHLPDELASLYRDAIGKLISSTA
jgi:hypothetical protein